MIRLPSPYNASITRLGVPRLMIGLSLVSALISALLLRVPWNLAVIALNAAVALLAFVDLKAHDRLAAEHDYLMSQSTEGGLAIVASGHTAETELDALVRAHFEEVPGTSIIACRHCVWSTDDFADRLRLAPDHLRGAHPEHDPRVPRFLKPRATRWLGRLLPPGAAGS
jgi:hypothetical protein